jgi:serine/threonine protein kinase
MRFAPLASERASPAGGLQASVPWHPLHIASRTPRTRQPTRLGVVVAGPVSMSASSDALACRAIRSEGRGRNQRMPSRLRGKLSPTTSDPLVGVVVKDRYELEASLARGGMATVYRAKDLALHKTVAVKILHDGLWDDHQFALRFEREVAAASRISDPGVVTILDHGLVSGRPYLVMEYVEGITLRQVILRESPMPPLRALDLLLPVLNGVAAAHRLNIVHLDLKPENILISSDGEIKVTDFGLARSLEESTDESLGLLIGTVSYIAPELVTGARWGTQSDVYSLAIILFEMLTGRKPYAGETPVQVAYSHVHDDIPAPSSIIGQNRIPPFLDTLVRTGAQRNPDERPLNAQVFRDQAILVRRALVTGAGDGAVLSEYIKRSISPLGEKLAPLPPLTQELVMSEDEARRIYSAARTLADSNPILLASYADRLAVGGDFVRANSLYATVIESAGPKPFYLAAYARVLGRLGDRNGVDRLYKMTEDVSGKDPELLIEFADAYTSLGMFADADAIYQRVILSSTKPVQALALRADALLRSGNPRSAIEVARYALQIDPANVALLSTMGDALRSVGQYIEAGDTYQTALRSLDLDSHSVDDRSGLSNSTPGIGIAAHGSSADGPSGIEFGDRMGRPLLLLLYLLGGASVGGTLFSMSSALGLFREYGMTSRVIIVGLITFAVGLCSVFVNRWIQGGLNAKRASSIRLELDWAVESGDAVSGATRDGARTRILDARGVWYSRFDGDSGG